MLLGLKWEWRTRVAGVARTHTYVGRNFQLCSAYFGMAEPYLFGRWYGLSHASHTVSAAPVYVQYVLNGTAGPFFSKTSLLDSLGDC